MILLLICIGVLFVCFALVVFIGAPYLPTMQQQQRDALDLLNLRMGQTVLDLGSGDGRFLRAAAKRGLGGVGIEANPFLVAISKIVTFRYRKNVRIIWGDMWRTQWPDADGIYVFLHTRFMQKLDTSITQRYAHKNVRVVSYAFQLPKKKTAKSCGALYLYQYNKRI